MLTVTDPIISPPAAAVQWEVLPRLDESDISDVSLLVERVAENDGIRPLSEHVMLHLRYGGDAGVRHILARLNGALIGYAHLDATDEISGPSAELAVTPSARRTGVGRQLVAHLLREAPDGRLRIWAHGDQGGAGPLASVMGMRRSRTLWQMRRPLAAALPDPVWPDGVTLRSFLPGIDDDEFLALNRRAFVDLPDQAGLTPDDLQARMCEPWFDPEGFLIAVEGNAGNQRIVGFHWTKVHGADAHRHGHVERSGEHGHEHGEHSEHSAHDHHAHGHGHEPMGEVYVVGVAPDRHGLGLGRALTLAGLQHLRSLGLPDAMLYVDASNTTAIRLYTDLGFSRWDVDVEFST